MIMFDELPGKGPLWCAGYGQDAYAQPRQTHRELAAKSDVPEMASRRLLPVRDTVEDAAGQGKLADMASMRMPAASSPSREREAAIELPHEAKEIVLSAREPIPSQHRINRP